MAPYRNALVEDGIPLPQLHVDDVRAEHDRLTQHGVTFTQPPTDMGEVTMADVDDIFRWLTGYQPEGPGGAT